MVPEKRARGQGEIGTRRTTQGSGKLHRNGVESRVLGRLAQLVRAPCSHRGGHRFESRIAHFSKPCRTLQLGTC